MAGMCGASYAAPYINRIETATGNAFEILEESLKIVDSQKLNIKIMAAAIKSNQQFLRCIKLGVPAITLPDDIYHSLFASSESVAESLHQFDLAWASNERMRQSSFFALD